MKAVFYGVGTFLLISLWLFILALQLIPTDLGNSYLIGSFLFLVGAGLLAGMASVGKAIIREIKDLNPLPVPHVIESEPVVTLPQIPISAPVMEEKTSLGKGAILATGAAAAAAGAVAGGLLGGVTRAEAAPSESSAKPEERFLDDLERDLFADIGKTEPTLFPASEAVVAPEPEPVVETEDSALLTPVSEGATDTGEGGAPVVEDEPEAVVTEEVPAPSEVEASEGNVDDRPDEPNDVVSEAPAASTPGLIADDDLAALQDDEPTLAPLEMLEVVGAYDSGGTRFTMYSDGSVTALGEGVDRRFKSLDDLRAFIDGGMKG
ncbi:MAG: hypothetical protein ACRDBL_11430 [Rhabdaerophilum sp.]